MTPTKETQISDIDVYLGYWLRFVSNQVTNSLQVKFAKKNVTVAEWLVLRFLWSNAPCSLTKLSEEMGLDKGALSRLTTRLEKRKLIKRTTEVNDRRLYSIALTPAGIKLVPELAKITDENDAYFFGHLSKKQFQQMMAFFKDMVERYNFNQKPFD